MFSMKSVMFLLVLFVSCKQKLDHRMTLKICEPSLYIESFVVFGGGALGGDIKKDYLTDSINFRVYTGKFNDSVETLQYICENDSIKIYRFQYAGSIVLDSTFYSIKSLKENKELRIR